MITLSVSSSSSPAPSQSPLQQKLAFLPLLQQNTKGILCMTSCRWLWERATVVRSKASLLTAGGGEEKRSI